MSYTILPYNLYISRNYYKLIKVINSMKKIVVYKKWIVIIIILFVLICIYPSSGSRTIEQSSILTLDGNILYVGGHGPNNYSKIQDAIYDADDNYTIFVYNGFYNENITINKRIDLIGENEEYTIINGNHSGNVVCVVSDNVTIKNFKIKNSNGLNENSGIKIKSNDNVIKNCKIYRTRIGIYILQSKNNKIINCILYANGNGIFINLSTNNSIKNSQFCHNSIGINLKNSQIFCLVDSYIHTSGIGIYIENSEIIEINQSAICDTNDNGAGIFLFRSENVDITNCNFYHNGNAIEIDDCLNILISKCDITFNTHLGAIRVENSIDKIVIRDCKISDNFQFAIYVINSTATINNNNIYNNKLFGVFSEKSRCNIRKNWWGFFRKPAFTGIQLTDRITRRFGKVTYFPWKILSIKNVGSNWRTTDKFEKIILPNDTHPQIVNQGEDTDNDGCTNIWELKWGYDPYTWDAHQNIDDDGDALNNIEECFTDQWNSNPIFKDVFLEIDWLESSSTELINKPSYDLIEEMKFIFQKHNINLHVDIGNMGEGEKIKYKDFLTHSDINNYYWNYFLHNDLNNPRKGIFHYCLITNYNHDESQVAMGWDQIDYLIVDAQGQRERHPNTNQEDVIVYPIMHELGHTFELIVDENNGIDNLCSSIPYYREYWKYRNYKSVMNYRYTYRILDYSDGSLRRGDFNDWGNLNFMYFKNTIIRWPKY